MRTTLFFLSAVLTLAAGGATVVRITHATDDEPMTLAVALLEADAPPGYPVEVKRGNLGDDLGWSDWDGDRETFIVAIDEDIGDELALWVLEHEWAHLLVWDASTEDDHGPLWGVAYARVYRTMRGPKVP